MWRRWIYALRTRLRAMGRPRQSDDELNDELSFHVAMQTQVNINDGMNEREAQRRAHLALGGVEQAKERSRDVRPLRSTETFVQDLRYSVRLLRRAPGFAAAALITLALGIGANTAIFSIVNGVILRPLPYPNPEQLMFLTTQFRPDFMQFWVSPPEYLEFREFNQSFAHVGAYTTGESNLTAGNVPVRVRTALVDEHLLDALGVRATGGRLFRAGETDMTGPPPSPGQPQMPPLVAILSHELWQTAFGGRPVVGTAVEIDGLRREVIGIMSPGTDVMDNRTEVWLPLGLNPANRQNRGSHYLYLIGRLKDGVSRQAAQSEMDDLMRHWRTRVGTDLHSFGIVADGSRGHSLQMKPMQEEILGVAGRSIWVLQASVGLVLLVACSNLANLLLARAESRQREFAVRTAIGASRGRLLQQFLIEGVVLSIAGGALGVALARAGVPAIIRAYPASLPRTSEVTVDPLVLLFTLGVCAASGIFFGLAPMVHTRITGLVTALKEGGVKGSSGARHHVRRGLVMAEIALAVMLVVGAGLLVRTGYNLASVDAGFDRSRLVTFQVTLPRGNYPQASARGRMYQGLLDELRGVAGVQAASVMSGLPPDRPVNANSTTIEGYTPPPGDTAIVDYYQVVGSDYFDTMGIPIVQGRGFQPTDVASSGMVAVVNETLVNTFWKGQNPIGRQLRPCCGDQTPWRTVVGVARDVKQGGVDRPTGSELYFFLDETAAAPPNGAAPETMNVVLRTTLSPAVLSRTIEGIVRNADPNVPVVRLQDMNGVFAESIRRPRLLAQLVGAFAVLALLLAAVGTYGLLSYLVAERRREIGIRLALGSDRSSVLAAVMKQGLVLTFVGLGAGLAGAWGLSRFMASLLFGVRPTDVPTLAAVMTTITIVAAIACWLPAWRASRLDPSVVLRDE